MVLGTKIFWIQVLFSDFKVEGGLGVAGAWILPKESIAVSHQFSLHSH